jgi:signal transduction histidine kinase
MPLGGSLTLGTTLEEPFVRISVSDTGAGVAQQDWGKLFTPFFTTKAEGTGLGLTVVNQVVENHRGLLQFNSTPGQGTTFEIRLAIDPEEHVASRRQQPSSPELPS